MDIAPTLSEQLNDRTNAAITDDAAAAKTWLCRATPVLTPPLEDWLRYWDDGVTDLGNLRNLDHWLSRSRRERAAA